MGRKNGNVRRSNARGRLNRDEFRPKAAPIYIPPPIEKMVIPDGSCTKPGKDGRSGQPRFDTKAKAQAALAQARRKRLALGSSHVEKRVYNCPFCPGYHLTSRETYQQGPKA